MSSTLLKYREALPSDSAEISRLVKVYVDDEEFLSYLRYCLEGTAYGSSLGFVAETEEGKLAGFTLFREGLHFTEERSDYFDIIRRDAGSGKIWSSVIVVTDEKFMRRGLGLELFSKTADRLKEKGVNCVLMEIWVRSTGWKPAWGLVRKYPWKTLKVYGTVRNFYSEAPGRENYICHVCGHPCRCSVEVTVGTF